MKSYLIRRQFKIDGSVDKETLISAVSRLQHYPGIQSVACTGYTISLEYELRDCSYTIVSDYLSELQLPVLSGKLTKLKAMLIVLIETNENANLNTPAGWPERMQKLYLSLNMHERG